VNRLVLAVTEGFASMRFRDALKHAWYGMQEARDRYRSGCVESGLDAELTRRWVESSREEPREAAELTRRWVESSREEPREEAVGREEPRGAERSREEPRGAERSREKTPS
jgi:hypothetical protein